MQGQVSLQGVEIGVQTFWELYFLHPTSKIVINRVFGLRREAILFFNSFQTRLCLNVVI